MLFSNKRAAPFACAGAGALTLMAGAGSDSGWGRGVVTALAVLAGVAWWAALYLVLEEDGNAHHDQ